VCVKLILELACLDYATLYISTWDIWLFVIGRRALTSDLGENGVKTLVCVCVCVCVCVFAKNNKNLHFFNDVAISGYMLTMIASGTDIYCD
jgi:hypothetical protein